VQVPKRRIYDITNVLEGVGLLVKQGKNAIQWVNPPATNQEAGHTLLGSADELVAIKQEPEAFAATEALQADIRVLEVSVV
jgi:hypothetical protein